MSMKEQDGLHIKCMNMAERDDQPMKRLLRIVLGLLLAAMLCACAVTAEELTGESQGYGGPLKVLVTMDRGKIASVQVTEHHETQGVGTRAIDSMPEAMVSAGSWDVDTVSGATVTSNALRAAVQNALGEEDQRGAASPMDLPTVPPAESESAGISGVGMISTARVGPGQDPEGNPVYSFHVVFAYGRFDEEGRVQEVAVDQLEVATPNDERREVPHFSGFPGQGGYAYYDDAQGEIDGKTRSTEETFISEVDAWKTRRQLGDRIKLTSGSWREQMDAYQRLFIGMTVEEIESWVGRFCSDITGRPLQADEEDENDLAKYESLSELEKNLLADVTSSATLSLRGEWGDIVGAIRMAWEDAQRHRP